MQRSPRFDPAESDREFSIAASDYTVTILADPLLRLVKRAAPRIRLNLHPLPAGLPSSSQALSTEDLLIGPVGYGFPGRHAELFRDRFVCVVDPAATGLKDAVLTLDDLSRMPHAAPTFAPGSHTPVDRVLAELGVTPRVRVTVFGWLSVPFVLAGTEMVAIMPERMARLAIRSAPLAILEPPFGLVELVEAASWHPSRSDDPAVRWLVRTLQEAASELGVQVTQVLASRDAVSADSRSRSAVASDRSMPRQDRIDSGTAASRSRRASPPAVRVTRTRRSSSASRDRVTYPIEASRFSSGVSVPLSRCSRSPRSPTERGRSGSCHRASIVRYCG
jgi:DNA-binding transcriptional LysR family regulator